MLEDEALLSRREVEQMTSLAKSTLYEFIAKGDFPRQVKVSDRRVAWRRSEVLAWINSRQTVSRTADA